MGKFCKQFVVIKHLTKLINNAFCSHFKDFNTFLLKMLTKQIVGVKIPIVKCYAVVAELVDAQD